MSIDYIERHRARRERQLEEELESGLISPADYNRELLDLDRESREEYAAYREERIRDIDNEMGWG